MMTVQPQQRYLPKPIVLLPLVAVIIVAYCGSVIIDTMTFKTVNSLQIPSTTKYSVTRRNTHLSYYTSLLPRPRLHSSSLSASGMESSTSSTASTSSSSSSSSSLPTLSSDTTWMIRVTLRNIKTQLGRTVSNQMYVINGQFIPEENYEPPQGTFVQQQMSTTDASNSEDIPSTISSAGSMQIASSRWILSEDPNDRKDGLWIWGLFQQPLYPYLLFSLETKPIEIRNVATATVGDDGSNAVDYIPALQLYVQLDHTCNRDTGAVSFLKKKRSSSESSSSSGSNNYELMIRQKEIIAADPLSLSKVEIYEEVSIGTISIQPKGQ